MSLLVVSIHIAPYSSDLALVPLSSPPVPFVVHLLFLCFMRSGRQASSGEVSQQYASSAHTTAKALTYTTIVLYSHGTYIRVHWIMLYGLNWVGRSPILLRHQKVVSGRYAQLHTTLPICMSRSLNKRIAVCSAPAVWKLLVPGERVKLRSG